MVLHWSFCAKSKWSWDVEFLSGFVVGLCVKGDRERGERREFQRGFLGVISLISPLAYMRLYWRKMKTIGGKIGYEKGR